MLKGAPLSELSAHVGETITVSAWLMAYRERALPGEETLVQARLEDSSMAVTAFVWPEHQQSVGPLTLRVPVTVRARVRHFETRFQLQVRELQAAVPSDIRSVSALLPCSYHLRAASDALGRLHALEASLPPPLQDFLKSVLLDPRIGPPLLRCRGSESHHHAYPGGLLVHSTDMLEAAATMAQASLGRDPLAVPMTQLGYLLHDLGKLKSVGESGRPIDPFVLRHETMTLELLAPHLARLDAKDRELGLGLRYILEYLGTPASARPKIAPYLVAEIVSFLDRCSAASHHRRDLASLLGRRPKGWDAPFQDEAANDPDFDAQCAASMAQVIVTR